jgi:serine/threonine protein kinase
MLGDTLGHYRLDEKIGSGGMGEVYRAHDEYLDRDVALKVLPAGTLADEVARKLFRKEALAIAKFNHPNIATVHEFNCQNGVDFLAMELIRGRSLKEIVKEGPLQEKEIRRLGLQLAEALASAHEHGVVHRDLKPANIMITRDGRLKNSRLRSGETGAVYRWRHNPKLYRGRECHGHRTIYGAGTVEWRILRYADRCLRGWRSSV